MSSNRTRLTLKTAAATPVPAGTASLLARAAPVRSRWYDVGSTARHFQAVHSTLEMALNRSVRQHALDIEAPPLGLQRIERGAAFYIRNCQQCIAAALMAAA